jgi:hypothetical protein
MHRAASALDRWVTVSGHFDDPAAAGCPSITVLECHERFAITAVAWSSPPPGTISGTWAEADLPPITARVGMTLVLTDREVVVWGGSASVDAGPLGGDGPVGVAFDPASGSWRSLPRAPLADRWLTGGVWTGREVVIMGGSTQAGPHFRRDGAAYDPATNRWRPVGDAPFAIGLDDGLLAWAGDVVAVENLRSGAGRHRLARYDPGTSRWTSLPELPLAADEGGEVIATPNALVLVGYPTAGGNPRTLELLDEDRGWRQVSDAPIGLSLPTSSGGRVVGFAGSVLPGELSQTSVVALDPDVGAWSTLAVDPSDWGWYSAAGGGSRFVVGGFSWRSIDAHTGEISTVQPPPNGLPPLSLLGTVGNRLVAVEESPTEPPNPLRIVVFKADDPAAFGS